MRVSDLLRARGRPQPIRRRDAFVVLARAGGLTELAFPEGSGFTARGLIWDDYIGQERRVDVAGGWEAYLRPPREWRGGGRFRARRFQRDSDTGIRQGDAIVVPLDVDQPLARWRAITQIIHNLAIAAAAVNSF
jgi:hypothetical protein